MNLFRRENENPLLLAHILFRFHLLEQKKQRVVLTLSNKLLKLLSIKRLLSSNDRIDVVN